MLLQIQIYKSEARYCPQAIGSIKYVVSCPTSKKEWDTAATKKNCSRLASHQTCSSVEQFKYHCVINGFRNETLEVCAPSRIIFGHCVEFNLHGGVIQDQMSTPCNNIFPKCDAIFGSTDAYKYPDCFDLVEKYSTTVYTTERKVLTTTPTTDKSRALIAVIASTGIMTILFISFFIAVVLCKRKRQSPKEKRALIKCKPADNKQDSNTDALAAHSKNGMVPPSDYDSRDDAFELNQEDKNIDDDDNNNDDNNIL